MRRAFTLIELLVVIAIILILCALLPGGGLDAIVALGSGWVKYPLRIFGERDIDWPNTLLCAACLAILTVGVHFVARWFAAHHAAEWRWSRSLKLVGVVMLMFLAGIVGIGVTHEVVWLATSKEPLAVSGLRGAYRTMSTNHLKQLGISAHSFHDIEKRLPAGATFDAQGRALHGWQTYLLPYVEQGDTFKKIDLAIPWNHPANAPTMYFNIQLFTNPAVYQPDSKDFAPSHYAGNVHVLGATPLKLNEIADGTTNTILAGEVAQNLKPWGMPMNCRDPAAGLHGPTGFGHPHGKQVQFLFADGSVRSLRGDISPGVLKALATPRGGEQIVHSDFD